MSRWRVVRELFLFMASLLLGKEPGPLCFLIYRCAQYNAMVVICSDQRFLENRAARSSRERMPRIEGNVLAGLTLRRREAECGVTWQLARSERHAWAQWARTNLFHRPRRPLRLAGIRLFENRLRRRLVFRA